MPPVRLEPLTPLSQVKHSTTEPLANKIPCSVELSKKIVLFSWSQIVHSMLNVELVK